MARRDDTNEEEDSGGTTASGFVVEHNSGTAPTNSHHSPETDVSSRWRKDGVVSNAVIFRLNL